MGSYKHIPNLWETISFWYRKKESWEILIKFDKTSIFSEMSTHIETAEVEEEDIIILSHDERNSPPRKKVKKSPKEEAIGLKRKRSENQDNDFNFSDTSSLLSKSVKGASTNRQMKKRYNLYEK